MPKKRTPTTDTPRSATEGCNPAVEISQADVPISATLEPMVSVLNKIESATQFQEPFRKERRRRRMGEE
jgi:hypothetical protein